MFRGRGRAFAQLTLNWACVLARETCEDGIKEECREQWDGNDSS